MPSEWILASEKLPSAAPGSTSSIPVLAVLGLDNQRLVLATYSYDRQQWVGEEYFGEFGQHSERLVTHWRPLPTLPDKLPTSTYSTLEPDFVSDETMMRALFSAVSPDEKELQASLSRTISFTGLQGVHIQTSGIKKGNEFYVDFWVHDPLELRDIKAKLDDLNIPYKITVKPIKRR